MNVAQIVAEYLKKNGFDGLVAHDIDCGCGLSDLHPCGEDFRNCQPAYEKDSDDPDYDLIMTTKRQGKK